MIKLAGHGSSQPLLQILQSGDHIKLVQRAVTVSTWDNFCSVRVLIWISLPLLKLRGMVGGLLENKERPSLG